MTNYKELKGSGLGIIGATFLHLLGDTEEYQVKYHSG
jgi:hypothetical protein